MSWLYSQALVEEYLVDTSWDGEQSVQSSGNHTQQAYLSPDKMTEYSRLSRFGMTFKPLTEGRGEALLMSYLAAFPAKTSALQAGAQGLTESDQECGEKWRGSFTKYDPDSSSWKTHQCSLLGGLDEFLQTWPKWGLMRDGECWEQQMSAHRTNETESGLLEKLPTPQSSDHITKRTSKSWRANGGVNFSLANPEIQARWPTPTAQMAGEGPMLQSLVTKEGGPPIPQERLYNPKTGNHVQITLNRAVKIWPTPTASNAKNNGSASQMRRNTKPLDAEVGGALNPMWVEWLMGWPLGWTDLKPLEMDKFQKWQEQHGRN
jgi:DNA (cytosine-5)-methyltransferase 1